MFGKDMFHFYEMECGQEYRPSQCIFEKSEYLQTGGHIFTAYLTCNVTIHCSKFMLKNKILQETIKFFFIADW